MLSVRSCTTSIFACHWDAGNDLCAGWQCRFWLMFSSQLLALFCTAQSQFFLFWWIYATTRSSYAVAAGLLVSLLFLVSSCSQAGRLVERLGCRALLIVANGLSALCLFVLIATLPYGQERLELIYLAMVIRSSMAALQVSSIDIGLTTLVPVDKKSRICAVNQTLQGLILVLSAPMGILLFNSMSFYQVLAIDLVATLPAILPLLCGRFPRLPAVEPAGPGLAQH